MNPKPCRPAHITPNLPAVGAAVLILGVALTALPSPGGQQTGTLPAPKAFPGWPKDTKPEAVIVISGQTYGYLQPCGCSRPQLGGLERRATFIASLKAAGWSVAGVDLGDILPYGSLIPEQGALKYATAMRALKEMGYIAVGVGAAECANGLYHILNQYAAETGDPPVTLCGNVGSTFGGKFTPRAEAFSGPNRKPMIGLLEIGEVGTVPVGVVSVVGPTVAKEVAALGPRTLVGFTPYADTLKVAVKELAEHPKKPQLNILLFQGTVAEAKQVATDFPQFQIIVSRTAETELPGKPIVVTGAAKRKTLIVQVGMKGQQVGVLGVFKQPDGALDLKYHLVELGEEYITTGDEETARKANPTLTLLDKYAETVKARNYLTKLTPRLHPAQRPDPKDKQDPKEKLSFVGSDKCFSCHAAEAAKWKESAHSHAMETLEKVAKRPGLRNYDPECVRCHAVGYGFETGYRDEETTPLLKHVGCESCHGPGSGHVANPKDARLLALQSPWRVDRTDRLPDVATLEKIAKLPPAERAKARLTAVEKRMVERVSAHCQGCHDDDNDPYFNLFTHWPKIHHAAKK